MTTPLVPVSRTVPPARLTAARFRTSTATPLEREWFTALSGPNTRRAYRQGIEDFTAFADLHQPEQFRDVSRAHVIAWRDQLVRRGLADDAIRRKPAARSRCGPVSTHVICSGEGFCALGD